MSEDSMILDKGVSFMAGGGEMGALMRAKDWTKTPLGDPVLWPVSLKTTIAILLHAKFPTYLLWGPEFICFYNDACRPTLADSKHPGMLGGRGEEYWAEVWHTVKPRFDQILAGGEAVFDENVLIPIQRHGRLQDLYWTFSYSPAFDDCGNRAGIFVSVVETTQTVEIIQSMKESERRFRSLVEEAPVPAAYLTGPELVLEVVNNALLALLGKDQRIIGKKLIEGVPELVGQPYIQMLQRVYEAGETIEGKENLVYLMQGPNLQTVYVNFIFKPIRGISGKIDSILAMGYDVTEHVDYRKKIEDAEERARQALDSAMLGTFDIDMATQQGVCSPRFYEIMGFGRDKTNHIEFINALHPDDVAIRNAAYRRALETGLMAYECRFIWPDRSIHWVGVQGKLFFDEHHRPVRLLGIVRDDTEKKKAEQAMEESERRFRTLANFMPQLIWAGDEEGRLNYFSQPLLDFSGISSEELANGRWIQVIHPDDRTDTLRAWRHSVQTGAPFIVEHRFRRYDGEYRWQLSRAIFNRDEYDKVRIWIGTSTDIDEIKKQEQLKDDFIKMASHELKTPVTTIKGYLQLLQKMEKGKKNVFLNEALQTMDKQVSKLTKLITDLLDVTKIETGSLQLNKEVFSAATLITEVVQAMKLSASNHFFTLKIYDRGMVYADKDRIEQVVLNLLTNAVKYSPSGGMIVIEVKRAADNLMFTVEDSGIGIHPEDRERIFERFYRAAGKDEKTFPGFGIGLFIAREIVELHNGTIWVEAADRQGSVFYVLIPLHNPTEL